jgi:5-(carboxyamino)imidazole ribonucleotide mutase
MTPPPVAILMGSKSDWPTMSAAARQLDDLGVCYDARVLSAHRMPRDLLDFGSRAADNGFKVLIAGAGGAAHLPGMLAAVTTLPVVGVPLSATKLGGMDALLSIVQMPRGVPVATVAVDAAANGALLAARILAVNDGNLADRLRDLAVTNEAEARASTREI